ncbi:ATP-binding protein [Thalassospira xianhensis]|nr:AAA family ATPase [Thalassospira xianhensis]
MSELAELYAIHEHQRQNYAKMLGRRDELNARLESLRKVVGLAKGRLSLRDETEAFLEKVQTELNQKTISSYTRLLTALVSDVLPMNVEIGIDLYTERGLPALDIFVKQGEHKHNIMDDCGGALTNVVCLGLRAIATAKSGLRYFMALDEPDCWVAPQRVPSFYRVLKQLSERMQFQTIVISHHDIRLFENGTNIISLTGTPVEGLRVDNSDVSTNWGSPETPGIRALTIRNFASFKDVYIPLSPGLNAIIGDNNIGKSRIMKLLRAVSYGGSDTSDADIRNGEQRAEVELHLERGQILQWSRERRRNPVNLWRLIDENGDVVEKEGTRCEGGGRVPPSWVTTVLGIAKADDLDIQLNHQKQPVFLLNSPPSQRAAVLSIGQESDYLRQMIAAYKTDCANDRLVEKDGERDVADILSRLKDLEGLKDVSNHLKRAEELKSSLFDVGPAISQAREALRKLNEGQHLLSKAKSVRSALSDLTSPPDIKEGAVRLSSARQLATQITHVKSELGTAKLIGEALENLPENPLNYPSLQPAIDAASRLANATIELNKSERVTRVLKELPSKPLQLVSMDEMKSTARTLTATNQAFADACASRGKYENERSALAVKIADIVSNMGNRCPLCHSHLEHDHFTSSGYLLEENHQ